MIWICSCGERMTGGAVRLHMQQVHGLFLDEYVEEWPDGGPVVWDDTLEPADFQEKPA